MFLLSVYVNSKNSVYLGTAVPEDVLQRPLHTVWLQFLNMALSVHIGSKMIMKDLEYGTLRGSAEEDLSINGTTPRATSR